MAIGVPSLFSYKENYARLQSLRNEYLEIRNERQRIKDEIGSIIQEGCVAYFDNVLDFEFEATEATDEYGTFLESLVLFVILEEEAVELTDLYSFLSNTLGIDNPAGINTDGDVLRIPIPEEMPMFLLYYQFMSAEEYSEYLGTEYVGARNAFFTSVEETINDIFTLIPEYQLELHENQIEVIFKTRQTLELITLYSLVGVFLELNSLTEEELRDKITFDGINLKINMPE